MCSRPSQPASGVKGIVIAETGKLMKILAECGNSFTTIVECKIVHDVKHIALDFGAEMKEAGEGCDEETAIFQMATSPPFGSERFRCPVVLFQPCFVREADISVWNGDTKAAAKACESEKADHGAIHANYSESIDALECAIAALRFFKVTFVLGRNIC